MESDSCSDQLSESQVCDYLNVDADRLHRMVKNHHLASLRNADGEVYIPAQFLIRDEAGNWRVLEALKATLVLLLDGGYDVDEATEWMLRPNDQLSGLTPVEMLRKNHIHEVRRVAAACAF